MLFNFFKKKNTKHTQLELYRQQLELCKTQLEFNKALMEFNREIYYNIAHTQQYLNMHNNTEEQISKEEVFNTNESLIKKVDSIYTEDMIHGYIENIEFESDKTDDTIKEVLNKY